MATAEDLFFYICPPTVSTVDAAHQVLTVATSGSAANYDWFNILGTAAPKGSCMLLLEASTKDVYVRFKQGIPESAAAAGTTIVNGLLIKADQPGRVFHVNPVLHGVVDFIATGVGSLQIQVCSPIGMRTKQ